jgi:hypothetical protein
LDGGSGWTQLTQQISTAPFTLWQRRTYSSEEDLASRVLVRTALPLEIHLVGYLLIGLHGRVGCHILDDRHLNILRV